MRWIDRCQGPCIAFARIMRISALAWTLHVLQVGNFGSALQESWGSWRDLVCLGHCFLALYTLLIYCTCSISPSQRFAISWRYYCAKSFAGFTKCYQPCPELCTRTGAISKRSWNPMVLMPQRNATIHWRFMFTRHLVIISHLADFSLAGGRQFMCGGKHENMWLDRYFKEQDPRPEALEDWHDALTDLQVEVFFHFSDFSGHSCLMHRYSI